MTEPQNPFAQLGQSLGLGETWQPVPVRFGWAKIPGTQPMHVLLLSTPTGIQGFAFDSNSMTEFARQATEQATGLVLPGPSMP